MKPLSSVYNSYETAIIRTVITATIDLPYNTCLVFTTHQIAIIKTMIIAAIDLPCHTKVLVLITDHFHCAKMSP